MILHPVILSLVGRMALSYNVKKNADTVNIDVGIGGTGGTCPQDLAINKEVFFLFSENAPFSKGKSALGTSCPSKFEMHPTSMTVKAFLVPFSVKPSL